MRSRARFRVVLHAENRLCRVTEARERSVVEVDVRRFAAHGAEAFLIDAETVILARDFHAARQEIAHWLVSAAVAKLQLPRRGTKRKREHLVA